MTARRTLGRGLAIRIAFANAISLIASVGGGFAIWALTDPTESAREELLEQLAPSAVIAAVGVALTVITARWLTRRATARIDALVEVAARVGAHDLSARLPASHHGDELDELAATLNQMLARIDAGIAAQRRFAADASHELRTPLTAARTALEVARRRPRSVEAWEQSADRAIAELTRMSVLVDALLSLARADAGLGTRTAIAVDALVDEVVERLASGSAIEIRPSLGDGLAVTGDATALAIALGNVVANALAHSPPGAVVAINATAVGDEVRIDVIDRGPGVALGERERIFEPFARGQEARADRVAHGAGVGLGLPIARGIVAAHGGRVDVHDALEGGAQFSLWLPAAGA